MENIKPLSKAVQSAVRSGFIIGDLTTVVEELIYNSLDAGATKVSVYVGISNGYVKVEDDGSGISRDGLVSLGERYATSKLHHLNDKNDDASSFGFRGEVLCSIADTSLIEIISKVNGRPNGYRKVMKGRKCLYLGIDGDRQDTGTTVIVRDLFYSQPVRRRQMQSSAKKVLHSVKKCAVRIALVHPRISFKVVDMESEDELLCTHSSSSSLPVLCSNFGIDPSSLHELSVSEGSLKLNGHVSGPSSSLSVKAIQYIYVNSRFMVKGPIHKVLNRLADMCWEQLSGDKGGKRGHIHTGPSYCLNLTCPRSSYELNLEFSRTCVEFKDWAPVLSFIEKSIMNVWRSKNGDSYNLKADQSGKGGKEELVRNVATVQKDWLLKTCQIPLKRRRIQKNKNEQLSDKSSVNPLEMQVEDDIILSIFHDVNRQGRNLIRNTDKFGEPQTDGELNYEMDSSEVGGASPSNCIFDVDTDIEHCLLEPDRRLALINKDLLESFVTTVQRDDYESFLPHSRWEDGFDDAYARNSDTRTGCDRKFELSEDLVQTPFKYKLYNNSPKVDIKYSETNRSCSNSIGKEQTYSLSHSFSNFQRSQSEMGVGKNWSFSEHSIESDMWQDPDITSTKYHDSLAFYDGPYYREHTPDYLSEQDRVFTSCFSPTDQRFTTSYPFLKTIQCDLQHLIQDEGLERRSKAIKCDTLEQFNDEKEEFYHDGSSGNCSYKNSFTAHLDPNSIFRDEYRGNGKGILEFSPHGHSFDDISDVRYGDVFPEAPLSSCKDVMEQNYGHSPLIFWSPSNSINIDAQIDRTPRERPRSGDMLADQIFSPGWDFPTKYKTIAQSFPHVSSISVDECPKIDLRGCQALGQDCGRNFSITSEKSSTRSKRSQSAPPIYKAKRRIFSMVDYLISTAENPAMPTRPRVCTVTGSLLSKGTHELEYTSRSPLFNSQHDQQREISRADESEFFEGMVKETSNIVQLGNAYQYDMDRTVTPTRSPGNFEPVQDAEIPLIKWRKGFSDIRQLDISNHQVVRDRSNQNRILDVDSSMLCLAGDTLVPKSINRSCLESAQVLLQLDKKFIPIVAGGILAVIDQHAADERIRLEDMRKKVLSGELKSTTYLKEEKELVLPEMAYQLLCNYSECVQHWGWICNIFSQDSGSFNKNLSLLNGQPSHLSLLAVPCILGVNLSDADLLEFLEQLADTDGSSTIPPAVVRILNYKACRGAIMFGDKLLPSECSLIVEELKQTSLCFQCAHGRPTTVPLVNLEALHNAITQLGSWRERSTTSWHGLCRKQISLQHAKSRLNAARFRG